MVISVEYKQQILQIKQRLPEGNFTWQCYQFQTCKHFQLPST